MGSIVVEDARPVQRSRDSCLNRVEDLVKFPRALPLVQLADALARLHVQGRKQRGGAVASRGMGAPFDLAGTQRNGRGRSSA